ncbi:WD40-repeat-containing domain protein [Lineolata rhizophorae]|uniref:WD40-repeat-containing domain protein n=1 Tax=Lineolata rhizophorae TaxID=578093 RepID=A0A6A6P9P5_9PEZI|nr:WD40-repeat-containing domain protein [Lineolata rhizophorae]
MDGQHSLGSTAPQSAGVPRYSTIGQLSYGPTTQTTVVTTTFTTTTSFPPLVFNPPKHLHHRDPKQYPLASSPTPQSLKSLTFDVGGKPARFCEADDTEETVQKLNNEYESLRASNGLVSSVKSSGTAPDIFDSLPRSSLPPQNPSTSQTRKRPSSHISIAEAAEIAGSQRRPKKKRHSLRRTQFSSQESESATETISGSYFDGDERQLPETPDTDAGGQERLQPPQAKVSTRRADPRFARLRDSSSRHPSGTSEGLSGSLGMPRHSRRGACERDEDFVSDEQGYGGRRTGSTAFREPTAGMSATPPIAESDLEPAVSFTYEENERSSSGRPSQLDTVATQDASLPSPSLSPITAAANLANPSFANSLVASNEDEDVAELSSLDASQDRPDLRYHGRSASQALVPNRNTDLPTPVDGHSPNPQLPTPTLRDIPNMVDTFDAMPDELKTYVMYQMLRRCAKSTLHFVADVVNPALKCDFIGLLPLELSTNVIRYLDARSLCRAAQVSKKWREIINSDEKAWKDLLTQDGYQLPEGEIERAVREGWGWQYSDGVEGYEMDLSSTAPARPESAGSPSSPSAALAEKENTVSSSGRPKRKATTKYGSRKRMRKGAPSSASQTFVDISALDATKGPNTYAIMAARAIPYPELGLASLKSLHLFKTIYQRHHLIRKSWMRSETKPKHIAFRAHQRHVVTCLQFDSDKILTGSDDTNIHVYDTKTGALRTKLTGHEGGVWALQYEGNLLVSGSTDRSVRVWDIEKGKCLQVFQGHTSTVRCLVILKPTKVGENEDKTPIYMPKEPLIITGSRDSSLRVWRLPNANEPSIFQAGAPANDYDNPYFVRALTGHHHSVRAIAARADTLVSGSYDSSVRVWKISTGELQYRLQGHNQKVYSVVLDHERNRCISGSMDFIVKVWSLETGQCLFNLEGHQSLVGLLDLSDGRLVSAAADSTLRIWDPETGQCKSTLSAHTGAITCFQHDGQKVISGSDRTLKMWDIKTGECVKDLLTDLSGVWQVKFNDRRCVAAVQRKNLTYIEVLDFGASRDGVPIGDRGRRIVVDRHGKEIPDYDDSVDGDQDPETLSL